MERYHEVYVVGIGVFVVVVNVVCLELLLKTGFLLG